MRSLAGFRRPRRRLQPGPRPRAATPRLHGFIDKGIGAPENLATAYLNRANIYAQRGKHGLALGDYAAAIALDPRNPLAPYNRGNLYFDTKRYDLAIADYTRAVELDREFALRLKSRPGARKARRQRCGSRRLRAGARARSDEQRGAKAIGALELAMTSGRSGWPRPTTLPRDCTSREKTRSPEWCCRCGLNTRPLPYQGSALPLSYGSYALILLAFPAGPAASGKFLASIACSSPSRAWQAASRYSGSYSV